MDKIKVLFYKNKEMIVRIAFFIGIVAAVILSGYGLQHLRDIGYLVQYDTPVSFSNIVLQGLVVVFGGMLAISIGTFLFCILILFLDFLLQVISGKYVFHSDD